MKPKLYWELSHIRYIRRSDVKSRTSKLTDIRYVMLLQSTKIGSQIFKYSEYTRTCLLCEQKMVNWENKCVFLL